TAQQRQHDVRRQSVIPYFKRLCQKSFARRLIRNGFDERLTGVVVKHDRTFVARSSDRSKSCFRDDTGISTTEAPFSTASSTTSMALWRGSMEPPRLIPPTTTSPPRRLLFINAEQRAIRTATPRDRPFLLASKARSWKTAGLAVGVTAG